MKGLFITLLIALGLIYSGPAGAATTLSDTELAGISGGGIDPPLHDGQSLPQEQQQPGSNDSGHTPPLDIQSSDGMDLAPELFAVLQSTINESRERRVLLNGATQQGAVAFTIENVISSDVISANNVFNGDSLSLDDETTEIEINQLNDLDQLHRSQGSLYSSIAGHRYEKTVKSISGSESYDYHAYSFIDQNRTNEYWSINTRGDHVDVGRRFTSLDAMKPEIITKAQLKLLKKVKLRVSELNLGSGLEIKGDGDIVADAGKFTLNARANLKFCFIWCVKIKIKLVTIEEELKALDPDLILPGDTGDTVETVDRDDNLVEEYKAIDVAESTFNESYERTVFTGGQMTGAEAELLALSEGTLSVENNSNVSLADGAQQNMRVFNGVNAVSSIAANALNVSRLPSFTAGPSAVSRISMQQHNRFNQQR